jgi:hypothetical protein
MLKFTAKFVALGLILLLIDYSLSTVLRRGLVKYDNLDKGAEVLCLGSSHTINGIDALRLEKGLGVSVAKYTKYGARLVQKMLMLDIYFTEHPKRPRVVVCDVAAYLFESEVTGEHPYIRFYPFMDIPEVGAYLADSGASPEEIFCRKYLRLLRYNDSATVAFAAKGYLNMTEQALKHHADLEAIQKKVAGSKEEPFNTKDQLKYLQQLIDRPLAGSSG